MENILVTGCAGFIGYHLCHRLLQAGEVKVTGIDDLNDYYDVTLKEARLARLTSNPAFTFQKLRLQEGESVARFFQQHRFTTVVNLAAQAGVRNSITQPHAYVESNVIGFANVLEGCRHVGVQHLIFASSSSVYGGNKKLPFSVRDNVDHPVSLYAATKKANELMAHSYAHLYDLPCTGVRFFTVYGPWGRPDMALFSFTRAILAGKPIDVYNHGKLSRDFTYIDDIIEGVVRLMAKQPQGVRNGLDASNSWAPYKIYNIGNSHPVDIMKFIAVLEDALGKKAIINFLPMQPGDVPNTSADVAELDADVGFKPNTSIESGVAKFCEWYRDYYGAG